MNRIPLSQQRINTLNDILEQALKIEAMARYPQDYKLGAPYADLAITGLQNQISTRTKRIKDIAISLLD